VGSYLNRMRETYYGMHSVDWPKTRALTGLISCGGDFEILRRIEAVAVAAEGLQGGQPDGARAATRS
jgi:hypothetical protein